jgi:hypothetical protein
VRNHAVRVLRRRCILESHVVEFMARRLLPDIRMNKVSSELIEGHNVRDGLAARLDTELLVVISYREMLSIYSSD